MAQRRIFEEVAAPPTREAMPRGGLIAHPSEGARAAIRRWLILLFVLVAAMIAVGGLTRLTGSGLSITEWRPVTGAIPPLDAASWAAEFEKYKATPQFALANATMTFEEFKFIYWWEWGHRQLGRLIGLVWAAGFLWFLLRRRIPPGWTGRLALVGVLGGLQGAIGWWMVSSGLVGSMVAVASYRLAVHLGLAFVILGLLAWDAMLVTRSEAQRIAARRAGEPGLSALAGVVVGLVFIQIVLGALVAGIDAGRAFPTWPLMGESFFPADAFYVPDGAGGTLPAWHAFFENPGLVQFIHRMWGYFLLAFGLVTFLHGLHSAHGATRRAFGAMALMLVVQIVLGIMAVLTAARLDAAIIHQIGAVVLWVLVLRARLLARYPVAASIREGGRT